MHVTLSRCVLLSIFFQMGTGAPHDHQRCVIQLIRQMEEQPLLLPSATCELKIVAAYLDATHTSRTTLSSVACLSSEQAHLHKPCMRTIFAAIGGE